MNATPTAPVSVAWIGLGAIGTPMARTAAGAGFPVTAFDLNPAAREAVADRRFRWDVDPLREAWFGPEDHPA